MARLVFGVGVNDSHYSVKPIMNGRQVRCPFYSVWHSMLQRCYSEKYQEKQPSYKGCTVSSEWHSFINFQLWMAAQDWHGKQLDKDLLTLGNKVYSPDTCAFVDPMTNIFTADSAATRGEWPIGVTFHKHGGKFQAQCRNPFTNGSSYLGLFDCPNAAHEEWRKRKHELACQLADLQADDRVADALRLRYAP